jgi:hypothetical protein
MSKAKRNRELRKQALAVKQSHPSDPRDQKGIARAIRKGRISGAPATNENFRGFGESVKMSTIKSKRSK